jgi:hypothetical protein
MKVRYLNLKNLLLALLTNHFNFCYSVFKDQRRCQTNRRCNQTNNLAKSVSVVNIFFYYPNLFLLPDQFAWMCVLKRDSLSIINIFILSKEKYINVKIKFQKY